MNPKNKPAKILIFEFSPDSSNVLARLLKSYDFTVTLACERQAFLSSAKSERPDFVILVLKDADDVGYEIIKPLRQIFNGVIIAIKSGSERDALNAGCDYHFTPPIDPDKLLHLLTNLQAENRAEIH